MANVLSVIDEIDALACSNRLDDVLLKAREIQNSHGQNFAESLIAAGLRAPDVLIAGPARTASTWLRGVLSKHPNISVAIGEPNILFNISRGNIHSTLSWYAKHDIWRGNPKNNAKYCDKSPSYIRLPDRDIAILGALFPNIKIIFGYRDETERLWSALHHRMNDFKFKKDWRSFCSQYPHEALHHIDAGKINFHAERWKRYFNKNNILILPYLAITTSPYFCVNTAIHHIDVCNISQMPSNERSRIEDRINTREAKKSIGTPPNNFISEIQSIINDTILH